MSGKKIVPSKGIDGSVSIYGAKNSALLLLAASVLSTKTVVLENIPAISDVKHMCSLLVALNIKVRWLEADKVEIDPSHIQYADLDIEVSQKIRTSLLFLGVMLGRFGRARITSPGGCKLGPRPIDLHLAALTDLGAKITESDGVLDAQMGNEKKDTVVFEKVTVTGSVNAILCAVMRPGKTVIENCALEPEIDDCIAFLNQLGAKVSREGSAVMVEGGRVLGGAHHRVIPDRIEAGTFLILATLLRGRITLNGVNPGHMQILLEKLKEAGAKIALTEDTISLEMLSRPKAVSISTKPYPGFSTDLQPQWSVLQAISEGESVVVDTIYPARVDHLEALEKMGACFERLPTGTRFVGVERLKGASVFSKNLRSAAALTLAAKSAIGDSEIINIAEIERGYLHFFEKIAQLELEEKVF